MSLEDDLKAEAFHLGFSLCGIAAARPQAQHAAVYEDWLAASHHGEMGYLAAESARVCRADLSLTLPTVRTVLTVALPYSNPAHAAVLEDGRLRGRTAAYAWGQDYHDQIPPRLNQLAAFLEARLGLSLARRAYTDTGPILERAWGQQAGLGWFGKNSCLIHPRGGSAFLLGELLLSAELQPDAPWEADRCGSCTRCLDACPTGCILPNRTLDARRCLSYWTIEHKGSIPVHLRPSLGKWVFGCDICQQVCPWNQHAAPSSADSAFDFTPEEAFPDLLDILGLSPVDFNRRFRRTPLARTKRRGFLRNAAVALGNLGDPAAAPALVYSLENEPEPLVRGHAAWALGQLRHPLARHALECAQSADPDPSVRLEAAGALAAL